MSSKSKIKYDTLLSTTIDTHEEKQCIRLSFKDGEDKFFCLGNLAKNSVQYSAITRSYESLIGKSVSITISDDTEAKTNSSNEGDQDHASSRSWVKYVWVKNETDQSLRLARGQPWRGYGYNAYLKATPDQITGYDKAIQIASTKLDQGDRRLLKKHPVSKKQAEINDVLRVCSLCGISDNSLKFYPEEKKWFHHNCKHADLVLLYISYAYTHEQLPMLSELQAFLIRNVSVDTFKINEEEPGYYTVRALLSNVPLDINGNIIERIRNELRTVSHLGYELYLFTEEHIYSKYIELYPEVDFDFIESFEIDFDTPPQAPDLVPDFHDWLDLIFLTSDRKGMLFSFPHRLYETIPEDRIYCRDV